MPLRLHLRLWGILLAFGLIHFSVGQISAVDHFTVEPALDRLVVSWRPTSAELEAALARADDDEPARLSLLAAVPADAEPTLESIVFAPFDETAGPQRLTLTEIGVMGGTHLVRISLDPFLPDGGVMTQIDFELHFNGSPLPEWGERAELSPIQTSIREQVINPSQVGNPPSARFLAADTAGLSSDTVAILTANRSGLVEISAEALQAAGISLSGLDPNLLYLTHQRQHVAMVWEGDGDTSFEANERFLFFADHNPSRWSNDQHYALHLGTGAAARINSVAATGTVRPSDAPRVRQMVEENEIYTGNCYCGILPGGWDGDRWVWKELRRPGNSDSVELSFSLDLEDGLTTAASEITLWMIGFTALTSANPDHAVRVQLNGTTLGTVSGDGKSLMTDTLSVPANTLSSDNTLTLTLINPGNVVLDGVWLDAFELTLDRQSVSLGAAEQLIFEGHDTTASQYVLPLGSSTGLQVWDVTDRYAPSQLTGVSLSGSTLTVRDSTADREYVVTAEAGILSPTTVRAANRSQSAVNGAEYLIIAPANWKSTVERLSSYRQSDGYSTTIETLESIYDRYGSGEPTPEAITLFIEDAYQNGAIRPKMVLLVGDGHVDPKGYQATSASILPPYLADADPYAGEVAADNRFVTVDGGDRLPDIALGRLPVNTTAELNAVIDKIIAYDSTDRTGLWRQQLLFASDNADTAGDFESHAVSIESHFGTSWIFGRIPLDSGKTATELGAQLRHSWNSGAGMVVFNGHSSVHQWAAERLFHLDDVPTLSNGDRLPVVLQMTCFTGSFHAYAHDTLDESLVRHADGGAIAVWGATGLGVATGHDAMADGFLESILNSSDQTLGAATMQGKLQLMTDRPAHVDLVDTFTLLGDPATTFVHDPAEPNRIWLPLNSGR